MKKFSFWVILLLLAYSLIEGAACAGLWGLDVTRSVRYEPIDLSLSARHREIIADMLQEQQSYVQYDFALGWTIQKNGESSLYRSNSAGIRGDKEYALASPADGRRITTFGDSFTHGDEVANDETWQYFMEASAPDLEVLNFGVGAYGLDQAYLRYLEDGQQYESDIVIIGFLVENILRDVNRFRPFLYPDTGAPVAKPRFEVRNGTLELIPNPMTQLSDYQRLLDEPNEVLAEMGEGDHFFQINYKSGRFDWSPTVRLSKIFVQEVKNRATVENIYTDGVYNPDSEAFEVTTKIFDAFYEASIENGSTPIIVVFPHRFNILEYQNSRQKRYDPLLTYFDSAGYRYIDLMVLFKGEDVTTLGEHYSAVENEQVAEVILNYLNGIEEQE